MPEYGESLISWLICFIFLTWLKFNGDPHILNLWADPTTKEINAARKGSPVATGHVYVLDHTSNIKRGQRHSQKPLYPPAFKKSKQPISSLQLTLNKVEFAARNVVFDLGSIWLQVFYYSILLIYHAAPSLTSCIKAQLFTHTMAQVYTRTDWEDAICKVPASVSHFICFPAMELTAFKQKKRGFRVSLALEFKTHVLAFVTLDNLFAVR